MATMPQRVKCVQYKGPVLRPYSIRPHRLGRIKNIIHDYVDKTVVMCRLLIRFVVQLIVMRWSRIPVSFLAHTGVTWYSLSCSNNWNGNWCTSTIVVQREGTRRCTNKPNKAQRKVTLSGAAPDPPRPTKGNHYPPTGRQKRQRAQRRPARGRRGRHRHTGVPRPRGDAPGPPPSGTPPPNKIAHAQRGGPPPDEPKKKGRAPGPR
ncbi:hypothetical protein SLA2020_390200 [Shorea laevis]